MKEYWELFWTFAKMGAVTFGGGYAMLPILERECCEKRNWITQEEIADYFAIGQCTPGLIAVNVSTFVGNKRKGGLGGIIATVGFAFVPMVLLCLVAEGLNHVLDAPAVRSAFAGVRVCVCVLILNAVLRLWKKSVVDRKTLVIFLAVLGFAVFGNLLPFAPGPGALVVLAALAGLLLAPQKGGPKK